MMFSKRSQEGYLLVDHTHAGPPPSAEDVANSGLKNVVGAGVRVLESATVTCSHCQTIVVLNPLRTRERGYCRKCDHYICDNPACHVECLPFKRRLDEAQEAAIRQEITNGKA